MAARNSSSGIGSSAFSSAAAASVAAHSAAMIGSNDRASAVSRTIRCLASAPGCRVTRPALAICAAVWLAAECVTPTVRARSRMELGPRATSVRTMGLKRGR